MTPGGLQIPSYAKVTVIVETNTQTITITTHTAQEVNLSQDWTEGSDEDFFKDPSISLTHSDELKEMGVSWKPLKDYDGIYFTIRDKRKSNGN